MRPLFSAVTGALFGAFAAHGAAAEPFRYRIDPAHFSIAFNADHIGYHAVWGMFLSGEGSFVYDEATQELSELRVTIDPSSVFTNDAARDDHLKSPDFLDAARHPQIVFEMTSAMATSDDRGRITGDLTLRGVARPVTLDMTLNKIGPYPFGDTHVVGVTARTSLRRSDFGSTYALDEGWVGDLVPLIFEIEAIRQGPAQASPNSSPN